MLYKVHALISQDEVGEDVDSGIAVWFPLQTLWLIFRFIFLKFCYDCILCSRSPVDLLGLQKLRADPELAYFSLYSRSSPNTSTLPVVHPQPATLPHGGLCAMHIYPSYGF